MPNLMIVGNEGPDFGDATVWHWPLNEGSGTTFLDTRRGDDLTHNCDYGEGVNGYTPAAYFNGTNDYGYRSGDTDFNMGTEVWSGAFWIKLTDYTNVVFPVFTKYLYAENPEGYNLDVQHSGLAGGGTTNLDVDINGTTYAWSVATPMTTGVWYHIAFAFSRLSLQVWQDGVSKGTDSGSSIPGGQDYDNTSVFYVGRWSTSTHHFTEGWYDDMWLVKGHQFTQADVDELYAMLS